jgi:hypothetical protein
MPLKFAAILVPAFLSLNLHAATPEKGTTVVELRRRTEVPPEPMRWSLDLPLTLTTETASSGSGASVIPQGGLRFAFFFPISNTEAVFGADAALQLHWPQGGGTDDVGLNRYAAGLDLRGSMGWALRSAWMTVLPHLSLGVLGQGALAVTPAFGELRTRPLGTLGLQAGPGLSIWVFPFSIRVESAAGFTLERLFLKSNLALGVVF